MANKKNPSNLGKVQNKILNREQLDDGDGLGIAKEVHKRAVAADKEKKQSKSKPKKKAKKK